MTVSGDSLMDDGILDGDILVVKRVFHESEVRPGRLVIAMLPEGRTVVKRIFFEGERIILRSANAKFKDMIFEPDQIAVEGIVKRAYRDFD